MFSVSFCSLFFILCHSLHSVYYRNCIYVFFYSLFISLFFSVIKWIILIVSCSLFFHLCFDGIHLFIWFIYSPFALFSLVLYTITMVMCKFMFSFFLNSLFCSFQQTRNNKHNIVQKITKIQIVFGKQQYQCPMLAIPPLQVLEERSEPYLCISSSPSHSCSVEMCIQTWITTNKARNRNHYQESFHTCQTEGISVQVLSMHCWMHNSKKESNLALITKSIDYSLVEQRSMNTKVSSYSLSSL